MADAVQANTGGAAGEPVYTPTGNVFIDGLNATVGAIGAGLNIYSSYEDRQVQREVDLLNAQTGYNNSLASSESEFSASQLNDTLKKSAFALGVGMMVFAATVYVVGRK